MTETVKVKHIKMSGTVLGSGMKAVSKNGKAYCKIPFREAKSGDMYVLMFFEATVETALTLKTNDKVSISGRKTGSKEENIVWVDFVASDTARASRHRDGEVVAKEKAELRDYYVKKDFVQVLIEDDGKRWLAWQPRKYCIEVPSRGWMRKIDWAMENLGPKEVERRLREKLASFGGSGSRIPPKRGVEIQELINQMCEEVVF